MEPLQPASSGGGATSPSHLALKSARGADPASLPGLSLELIEMICGPPLTLQERIAAASCCTALWARADVAGSLALWGDLHLRPRHLATPAKREALLAWLVRRRAALRRVEVEGEGCGVAFMALLRSLAADRSGLGPGAPLPLPLSELVLARKFAPRVGAPAALQSLAALGLGLTRLDLRGNNLFSLPRAFSELTALAALELGGNKLAAGDAQLRPLAALSRLTRLGLADCGLAGLPRALSGLLSLQDLDASGQELDEVGLQPLAHLGASLRHLALGDCGLQRCPPLVASLTGLLSLDLAQNNNYEGVLEFGEGASLPPSLTRLDISECGLYALPACLSALSSLEDLSLRSNYCLGRDDPDAAFQPLEHLTALTRLILGGFALGTVPAQLASLRRLRHLDLSSSDTLSTGGDAGLRALTGLAACLTRLDLGSCNLARAPAALGALSLLRSLELSGNEFEEPASLALLSRLRGLTRLDLGWCGLPCLPPALSALGGLVELEAGGNRLAAPDALQPLQHLAVTRLGLAHCDLRRLPPLFAALGRSLRDLDISKNAFGGEGGRGGAGGDAPLGPLAALRALSRLDARRCGLRRAPAQLSALRSLAELNLGSNALEGEEPLEGLQHCTALRMLSVSECSLTRLPPQLRALPALEVLCLSGNGQLLGKAGGGGGGALRLPARLTALSYLDVAGCGLQGQLSQVSALVSLGVRVRC